MKEEVSTHCLFAENLHIKSPGEARHFFGRYGDITDMQCDKDKQMAIIDFARSADAEYVYKELHKKKLNHHHIRLDFATEVDYKFFGWKWPQHAEDGEIIPVKRSTSPVSGLSEPLPPVSASQSRSRRPSRHDARRRSRSRGRARSRDPDHRFNHSHRSRTPPKSRLSKPVTNHYRSPSPADERRGRRGSSPGSHRRSRSPVGGRWGGTGTPSPVNVRRPQTPSPPSPVDRRRSGDFGGRGWDRDAGFHFDERRPSMHEAGDKRRRSGSPAYGAVLDREPSPPLKRHGSGLHPGRGRRADPPLGTLRPPSPAPSFATKRCVARLCSNLSSWGYESDGPQRTRGYNMEASSADRFRSAFR